MDLKEGAQKLVGPVAITWNSIGYDIQESFQSMDEILDNESAIESCLDADRLLLNANDPVAHQLCTALCMEHGFDQVVRAIAREVTLA